MVQEVIQSGRTESVKEQLDSWYNSEYKNVATEWDWGFNKEAIEDMLDKREAVPFRCFFVRYILAVHEAEVKKFLPCFGNEEWLAQSADLILKLMEQNEGTGYDETPEILKKLVDLVFDDFVSNKFFVEDNEKKLRGNVIQERPVKGQTKTRPVLWDRNALFAKLKAKKITSCGLSNSDSIGEDDLFAFAFGLNMDYEDISYLMQKALRRSSFNMWNWNEFLLYVTYKYAKDNKYAFYLKLKETYLETLIEKENEPKEYKWEISEDFSTKVIQNKTDEVVKMIEETDYSVALNKDGSLPTKMVEYIYAYKYLIKYPGNYTRTMQNESCRLLQTFKEHINGAEKAASQVDIYGEWDRFSAIVDNNDKKEKDKTVFDEAKEAINSEVYAQGKVIVYYDSQEGLSIPKGTIFTKLEKESKKVIEFISETDVEIKPSKSVKIDVEIPVVCKDVAKEQKGVLPKNTKFTSKNRHVSDITNKSKFKIPAEVKNDSEIHVTGKLYAKCDAGQKIKEGTEFIAIDEKNNDVIFLSKQEINTEVCEEIWVKCLVPGKEAAKGEITGCDIPDWESRYKLNNSMIGFIQKQEENKRKGGVLYNYLYQPHSADWELKVGLDEKHLEKLANVLEGTQLSSTKLSQIKNKKAENITRNDILTLSFLAYMSKLEDERVKEDKGVGINDYESRYAEFFRVTNKILEKCGYHGLYAPNPYDSLIICLLSSNEAIDSYRNMWSWYLSYKEKHKEKK